MFEPEIFRKQMYCIEESICDIVGTFWYPPQSFGTLESVPPLPLLVTSLELHEVEQCHSKCILLIFVLELLLQQQICFLCTCNCAIFIWKHSCHLPTYSTPVRGLELLFVSIRRTVLFPARSGIHLRHFILILLQMVSNTCMQHALSMGIAMGVKWWPWSHLDFYI